MQSKPRNYEAVRSNIKADGLTGRKLDGSVRKQLTRLKNTDPYLFYGERMYRLVPVSESAATEIEE